METKELIEFLELKIAYDRTSICHHGYFREIIEKLKEHEKLRKIERDYYFKEQLGGKDE